MKSLSLPFQEADIKKTSFILSPIFLICLGAFLLRLSCIIFYPDPHFPDAETYKQGGITLFNTGIFPTDYHMPLYSLWTYLMGNDFILKFSDAIFSTVSVWLIYRLSLIIFNNLSAALIAATISAIYPHFLFYTVTRLTETSYIFLMLLGFLLLYKKQWKWASFILAVSILERPTLELYIPFLIGWVAFVIHQYTWKETLKKLGFYGVVYCLVMAPWWIHNYTKYHHFVRLNLGDAFVLYSGNNPLNQSGGGVILENNPDLSDLDLTPFSHITDPLIRHAALKKAAIDFILENPQQFIKLAGIKFLRFWRLWPYTSDYSQWYIIFISLCSYGAVLGLALTFVVQHTKTFWRSLIPIYGLIGYLTAVHMILIGSIRYRLPLEPFLIIFAGYTLNHLYHKHRGVK